MFGDLLFIVFSTIPSNLWFVFFYFCFSYWCNRPRPRSFETSRSVTKVWPHDKTADRHFDSALAQMLQAQGKLASHLYRIGLLIQGEVIGLFLRKRFFKWGHFGQKSFFIVHMEHPGGRYRTFFTKKVLLDRRYSHKVKLQVIIHHCLVNSWEGSSRF